MTLTPQMIDAMNKATGGSVPLSGVPPVPSRADEIRTLVKPAPAPSLGSRISTDIQNRGAAVEGAISGTSSESQGENPATRGVQATAQAFGGVADVGGEILKSILNADKKKPNPNVELNDVNLIPKSLKDFAGNVKGGLGMAYDELGTLLDEWTKKHPEGGKHLETALKTAGATGEIAGTIAAADVAGLGANKIPVLGSKLENVATDVAGLANKASESTGKLYDALTTKDPAQLKTYMTEKFNKGVRPSVTSAKDPYYADNALSAVKTIVENKPNMTILDKYGEATGKVPQTLDQFRQAIEQTKENIFNKYDALQKAAGEKGATVSLEEASKNLREIQNNPTIQDLHPEIAKYAETRADALDNRGAYNTQQTQDAIKSLNNSLNAFYKNPSYDTASRATVDSMVVNNLRKGLDATIESAGGEGYQALKNDYANLKAIEKDVVNRALVDARKNTKGLLDFTDIATGFEAIEGLLTLNPTKFITSAGARGIKELYKHLNDPNTAIKQLFKAAEKDYLESLKSLPQNQPKNNVPTNINKNSNISPSIAQPESVSSPSPSPKGEGGIPETNNELTGKARSANVGEMNMNAGAKNSSQTPFTTPIIRELTESEKPILGKVNSILEGKSSHEIIGNTPDFVSADGKERPLVFSKTIADKIIKTHGEFAPENLVLNANDWDYVIKNFDNNPDKINLIKKIPDSDNFLTIGATRDNGFYVLTHYEAVAKNSNKLKNLLENRGDTLDRFGRTGSSLEDSLHVNSSEEERSSLARFSGVKPDEGNIANAGKEVNLLDKIKNTPNKQGGFMSTGYKETGNLTTKILKDLEGRETVSRQYILDATNRGELKQVEREITRQVLDTMKGDTINVKEFADKVKSELLPLKRESYALEQSKGSAFKPTTRYENIALPNEVRGNVKNYSEQIYKSPIKTSAGETHFGSREPNYFGHTRIEDMADGKTRRVIEVQSDLYQKGRLEQEKIPFLLKDYDVVNNNRATEIEKLQQYNDPTAHFRMIREELRQAAIDKKTKLQFPTGETAMKIEGLGSRQRYYNIGKNGTLGSELAESQIEVGREIMEEGAHDSHWIITDVLGDGKFKAVPKNAPENGEWFAGPNDFIEHIQRGKPLPDELANMVETFDISGKVDTQNPIYKFYEKDIQNYLKRYGGKQITDKQGVKWVEVPITKAMAKNPVQAFGKIGVSPLLIGAGVGAGAVAGAQLIKNKK